MFDRFIRLARARKALREQRFEDALQLADDPLIRSTARAEEVRDRARDRLLERGGLRLQAGDLRAARALFKRLTALADNAAVQAFGGELEAGEARAREAADAAQKGVDEARKLMGKGRVAAAAAAVAAIPAGGLKLEREQLEQQLAERQKRAAEHLRVAAGHLEAERIAEARKAFAQAVAMDRDGALASPVRARLADAVAGAAGARILAHVDRGELTAAFHELRAVRVQVATDSEDGDPLRSLAALKKPLQKLEAAVAVRLRKADDLASAASLADAAHDAGFRPAEPTAGLLAAIRGLAGGTDAAAAARLQKVAGRAGAKKLAALAGRRAARQDDFDGRLAEARALVTAGDLDAARERLTRVVAEDPMHEAARRELDLVEQGITELGGRLADARAAAKDGRLREACATALAIGTNGRVGAEAQLLLTDVRARMALVDRGLDEVRAALHGKAAGSLQGVTHCLGRLEELAKVQVDHAELEAVVEAVRAEIAGLTACDRAGEALDRGDVGPAASALREVLGLRGRLLQPERLDARLLALADRFEQDGERALAAGSASDLELCAGGLDELGAVGPEFPRIATRLRDEARSRAAAADEKVAGASASLERRDLPEAERLLEEATELWAEAPSVRTLGEKLQAYRRQTHAIEQVAELAKGRDYRGAAEKLAAMPPTPALLRTRIFDMKQQLAKAQGLEGAFLMRVDEGGEHLVLRGESVSIGNMRQNCADLPVLANVAGKHATIRRSMSFHGGMEDRVVAEDGEVTVNGTPVRSHRLGAGDRIQFGPSLAAVYQAPTSRSLTVGLTLQGGFQVAGTERILLMKDRGKDGRILLGPSQDVHVRVGSATGEVEVFAASTGQIRVRCRSGGTIDGSPFKGEHPVDAGQVVTAGGITFVLLPWRPS